MADIKIYKLVRNTDVYFWLCQKHFRAKKSQGWEWLETIKPPHELECEECKFEARP